MSSRLAGKVAAITGASQGIGLAIAQKFAAEGADIAFCYRSNKAGANEVNASIQKLGRKCIARPFIYLIGTARLHHRPFAKDGDAVGEC